MDNNDGSIAGLEKTLEICRKFNVKSYKQNGLEIEFEPVPQVITMTDDEIRNEVSKFRKVADEEQKEFDRTLFHSSEVG